MNASLRPQAPMTSAEFHRLTRAGAFAGLRVELRRGMVVQMNAQYAPHAAVKRKLAKAIEAEMDAARA